MTAVLMLALALAVPACAASPGPRVRAWEGQLELPTYDEGAPDVNPPFDVFETRRYNYPYTLRENLTDHRSLARWRTLELENEYLHCTVLPDLGGHLYGCVDKANGAQMFYANTAVKKARVAYRGAWTALGIEFNFPVSHNWATVSPVDHAIVEGEDGSASVWVGNVDRVYGMQWRVSLTLRPGSSALEQDVALYNPTDVRHRFYWWNNAGVRVWDDSRIEYPMRFTAAHGFKEIDTWPVNQAGVDLSVVGNHTFGPVSQFSHGSREAFMGVYHPHTRAGVVHYSSPEDAPTKKIWSWGRDADGLDWRKALSDDESAYVEVQAGLFRNQETYAFLEPQEVIRFREFWMPVRDTGGITRANPDAVLHLMRAPADPASLTLDLNVSRSVRAGTLRLLDGGRLVREEPFHLTPAEALHRVFAGLSAASRYTVEVRDDAGRALLTHTEGEFDMVPAAEVKVGPVPRTATPAADQRTDGDFVEVGQDQELNGKRLLAYETYREGRKRFPDSFPLLRAAGRLAVDLERYDEAADLLQQAAARATTDAGVRYHLGLARAALGDDAHARTEWEAARPFRAFAAAATLKLAQLEAREGPWPLALQRVREALASDPQTVRLGALEVALLRRAGRTPEARLQLAHWRALDPTSSLLRYEAVRLGTADGALFEHLGADPQRVLNIAVEYMGLGLWSDALDLLDRRYPVATGLRIEPGAVPPQDDPEVAYYRGFARERSHGALPAGLAAAGVGPRRGGRPRMAGGAPPRPPHSRPAPQPGPHAASGERRRRGRAGRLRRRRRRRSHECRPVPGRGPGDVAARPPGRGARRALPPLPRRGRDAAGASAAPGAGAGRGGTRGRRRGAAGRPVLPARGVGHQRAPGVRGDPPAEGAGPRARGPGEGSAGDRAGPGAGSPRIQLHQGRPRRFRAHAAHAIRGRRGGSPGRRSGPGPRALDGGDGSDGGLLPRPALELPGRATLGKRG
jgi:tetratricopeptide (TPR) repeat protein